MNDISDKELLSLVQKGKLQYFEEIVLRYENRIRNFVLRYLKGLDVDDIVQETFVRLYKNINRFNKDKVVLSYLFSIAKNLCMDYFRSRKKLMLLDDNLASDEDVLDKVIASDINIDRLAVEYKEVINMYYLEGFDISEISKKLKLNINTVKTRMRRGREMLYKLYEKK